MKTVHYFGQDIVLYRTDAGQARAIEPFCPHMGAHLGHGGCVDGEVIQCPFHHWRFGADGHCVSIPGASKLPKRATLQHLPLIEQDDVLLVFHDVEVAEGLRAVAREPFAIPPLGPQGFAPSHTVQWSLRTHPQEVCENTVDMAHLRPIHGVVGSHVVGKPHIDGAHMNVVLEFTAPGDLIGMPGQDNDVQLDVILHGLGRIVARTHVRNVDVRARQAIYCTPVDGERMDLRGVVNTAIQADPDMTASLSELFFESFVEDFQKDFHIWENKRYVERPLLSAADGPVSLYRRWTRQFYPQASSTQPQDGQRRDGQRTQAARPRSYTTGAAPPQRLSLLTRARETVQSTVGLLEDRLRRVYSVGRQQLSNDTGNGAGGRYATGHSAGHSTANATDHPVAHPAGNATAYSAGDADSNGETKASAPSPKIATAEEYFATLDERFRPAGAAGVKAVFQWKLSGDGGGTRYAVVDDGTMALHDGEHTKPTVTIAMKAADYVRMVNGELDGARAFTTGKAKLSGSIPMAMKMRQIFPQ